MNTTETTTHKLENRNSNTDNNPEAITQTTQKYQHRQSANNSVRTPQRLERDSNVGINIAAVVPTAGLVLGSVDVENFSRSLIAHRCSFGSAPGLSLICLLYWKSK